ncbi:DUF4233 domain-containing protein [Rhodococcus chondri]|uniref:DUF4233 domain-containing protein n=1 Tax=Rhodococcus chondri TaxID=3065941 RepID=A0ABU7K0Y0_9NOCA|nr:DUF4233 domain-containing protein [Rhodococcus sp. CC-R104]MEE2035489.1 DUF4233 domain-containing protein [Rhodococcus sp. CC-R104]
MSNENQPDQEFGPPTTDPWKGFRGVAAGTLVLEAIVVLLVLPVIATLGGGLTALSGGYVIGLAVAMVVGAGLQRRSWAMPYNIGLQVLTVLGFFVDLSLGAIGVLFSAVWAYLLYLCKDIQEREARGLLPGQRN